MKNEKLAIEGGRPVHTGQPIPLAKVCWDEREQRAVQRVFESGIFCSVYETATEVKNLEVEFAREVGARYAVAFNAGTTAQHAALLALNIGPGDEVIVPPLTFISTAYTVLLAGAVPVFADVSRDTITIDPDDIVKRLSPRTKAIVPVHWFGHPAEMDSIVSIAQEHGLSIVEDCAHGPGMAWRGQKAGTFGRIACWSLQQTKLLTAAGEGGMATTDDPTLAARLRQIRDHGKAQEEKRDPTAFVTPYRITALGNNYRLSEMHAAFARAQLSKLGEFRERRRKAFTMLREGLRDIAGLELTAIRPGAEVSYVYFPVLFPREAFSASIEQITAAFRAEGIIVHPIALDELCHVHPLFADPTCRAGVPAFQFRGDAPVPPYGWGTLPVAEKIAGELLLLPMHPDLSEQDVADIIEATRKIAHAYRR